MNEIKRYETAVIDLDLADDHAVLTVVSLDGERVSVTPTKSRLERLYEQMHEALA